MMSYLCRQIVGAPVGGLLGGDEGDDWRECGREALFIVRQGRKTIARVCKKHTVRFRRMAGYTVTEESDA